MQITQKQKPFSELVSPYFKSILNFERFQKKMTLIADVFPKLRTLKYVVKEMSKNSCFRRTFNKQQGMAQSTVEI